MTPAAIPIPTRTRMIVLKFLAQWTSLSQLLPKKNPTQQTVVAQTTAPLKLNARNLKKGIRKEPARIPEKMRNPVMKRATKTAHCPCFR